MIPQPQKQPASLSAEHDLKSGDIKAKQNTNKQKTVQIK